MHLVSNCLSCRISNSPKKGKIEVEEYDKRLAELEKHDAKLKAHKEDIMKKNEQDTNDNNALLEKVDKNFSELSTNYETLSKQIEEEENGKGLEDKFKQFKTMYYDFISQLSEDEVKLNDDILIGFHLLVISHGTI